MKPYPTHARGRAYLLESLNDLAVRIHANNVRLGFWDSSLTRDFDGELMNVVAEVAETQEAWRDGHGFHDVWYTVKDDEELADSLRMIGGALHVRNYEYDFKGSRTDIPEWLRMTPELLRQMPNITRHLKPEGIQYELADIIIRVLDSCAARGINIAAAIADKMAFNETRPYRHGGKRT